VDGATTAYPATNATWTDYTINIGQGVAFGSQTTTFATNFVGAPTTCRSGPLTINAGAFPLGGPPRPFGAVIPLTTPFTYTGGNLLIEIRHTGSNIVNSTSDFLEVALTTDPSSTPRSGPRRRPGIPRRSAPRPTSRSRS
jgi:hypothetical protein